MIILKELKFYSKEQLAIKFDTDPKILDNILHVLVQRGIVKYNTKSNIQFSYVGIIIVENKSIFFLPKYFNSSDELEHKLVLKNILVLLNEFTQREKLESNNIEDLDFDIENLNNNIISIITFLLDDYIENGIYQNEIDSYELNGAGDINWCKTMDEIDPIVINNQWFYSDLITNKSLIDSYRFITMLHGKVINECLDFLNKTGLNDFLDYNVDIFENALDDLQDIYNIENEIYKELSIQFNDRKRKVLFAIKSYLEKKSSNDGEYITLYGTRNFKWIWEKICEYVFDNEFINVGNKSKYEVYGIEAPIWNIGNNTCSNRKVKNEIELKKNRLTPDILKVFSKDNKKYLLILDAKYYNMTFKNEKLQGNPGIEDITKQYLYHSALKKYINNNRIDEVINAFLFPTQENTHIQGEVYLDFMKSQYSNENIKLVQLNVNNIIEMYCSNKKYNIKKFIEMVKG